MAVLKGVTRNKRGESLRGRFMIDTVRGVLRVRKWPKKRGTPKSELQLYWIRWFRQANKLAKYVDAATMRRAIQLTAGTGKYPRDIILQAMRGRLYTWTDENGKKWYPMAGVQDISDSLDILAQNVGSVLVRAVDRWRSAVPGTAGDVLTYQGPSVAPAWGPVALGGLAVGQIPVDVAPAGAFATQGWALDLALPLEVRGISLRLAGAAGLNGFAGLYLLTAGTWQIATVLGVTATVAGPTSANPSIYLPFAAPVSLAGGTRVALAWTRTDGGATGNSKAWSTLTTALPLPCAGSQAAITLASVLPSVGNTFATPSTNFWSINPIFKL